MPCAPSAPTAGCWTAAFPTPRMVMWSGSGKRLGEVANGIALDDGTTSQTILRGRLHRALRDEAASRGIPIVQGKRLVAAEDTGTGVLAAFEDGTEVRAAMLVGADGLHSKSRGIIDTSAPSPRDTGLLSLGGRAATRTLEPTPDTFHMIFGKQAFFGFTVRPSGEVYWFANIVSADIPARRPVSAIGPALWKERLRTLFAGDAGPAAEIIDATGEDLAAYPILDMPAVPRWHAGPMVITGDAAHATSPSAGQGASLAIEDAVVLAKCLRDAGGVGEGLPATSGSGGGGSSGWCATRRGSAAPKSPGPIGRWFRDLCMPAALRIFAGPKAHAWLYRHHIDWSERVGSARSGPR